MQISASRLILLAVGAGSLVVGIFLFWLHSPFVLAIIGGIGFGAILLLVAASLGDDPVVADEAWREASADLIEREPNPTAGAGSGSGSSRTEDLLESAGPAAALPTAQENPTEPVGTTGSQDADDNAIDDGHAGV